ncbi:MAG: hypothetical protein ACI4SS_01740, partial [Clostridia bacterium]
MKHFYRIIVKSRKAIILVYIAAVAFCMIIQNFVAVNYDINDYLPDDSPSTVSLDVMDEEFEGDIPNARVMIRNVSVNRALEYKDALEAVDGVEEVLWLD